MYFADDGIPLGEDNPHFSSLVPILQNIDPCIALLPEIHGNITQLFSKMGLEILSGEEGWQEMVWAYLSEILVTVSRQKAQAGVAVQPTPEMSGHIVAVIDFLNMHYTESVSLASVAERFHLSASHLSRSFKEATHFGFVEYVNSLRITKACHLLADKNLSVLEIAMQCGFGSLTQFGRCFRALTGTNPLDYRKSI